MNAQPFSEIVFNETEVQKSETPRPFVDEASGGEEIEEENSSIQEQTQEQLGFFQTTLNFLGSIQGLFSILTFFTLLVVILNMFNTIETLLSSNSILDTIYLIGLTVLATALTLTIYVNYRQLRDIKNVKETQEFFTGQKANPDKRIVKETLKLLDKYALQDNSDLKLKVEILRV